MTQLDEFQEEAIAFIGNGGGRAIYADDMGGRKTGTTATWLQRERLATHVLIVAPKAVHVDHWQRELARFAPRFVTSRGRGTKAQRFDRLEVIANSPTTPVAYVTTYDGMKADEHEIIRAKFDTVIFDEGHRLKGRTTLVAKVANVVSKRADRLVIVTGTPILNHAEELWQYLHMLYPRQFTSFWRWVGENFIVTLKQFKRMQQPTRVIGDFLPGREEVLRAQLSSVLIQREIGELFPGEAWTADPLHEVYEVELTPAERKFYDRLVKHSWGALPTGTLVNAANKLVVSGKLQQVASDWGGMDEKLEVSSKVIWAADDITEWARDGVPLVAFVKYRATARRLQVALEQRGLRARTFTGDDTDEQKASALQDYAAGKVDVVVGTLGSLAEGVDGLQYRSHRIAMLDRLWVPGLNDQAIGRLRRSGQRDRVEVRHYVAAGTTDVVVMLACLRKVNVVRLIQGRPLVDVIYGRGFDKDDELVIAEEAS